MSSTCGRNACAVLTTSDSAGYALPFTVNGAVARSTLTPDLMRAFTKSTALCEVRLVGRHDVAARVAQRFGRQRVVERHVAAPAAEAPAAASAAASRTASGVRQRRLAAGDLLAHRRVVLVDVRADARCLVRRERPVILAAPLNLVAPHLIDPVEQALAVPRGKVEHRAVGRDRVVHRLPEMPDLLRLDRPPPARLRHGETRRERNLAGIRSADRFGQDANLVVEVRRRAEPAVPPGRVRLSLAVDDARLALLDEAGRHHGADQIDIGRDLRVEVVVERITERRCEHHRAGRPGLVMVVHDLRDTTRDTSRG